jgi:hypothetical protein
VVCGLISKGEWVRSVLGHKGSTGVLGLGERGGGGCERAQQGALLVQEPKVGLLPNSLVLHTKKEFGTTYPSLLPITTRQEMRVLLQWSSTRGW